jgi:hypothetical protein
MEAYQKPEIGQAGSGKSKRKPGNRETGKPGNRETGKPGNRETGKPGNRETEKPRNRETEKPRNRETEKPRNRETGKHYGGSDVPSLFENERRSRLEMFLAFPVSRFPGFRFPLCLFSSIGRGP